jgi:hypothetical protein
LRSTVEVNQPLVENFHFSPVLFDSTTYRAVEDAVSLVIVKFDPAGPTYADPFQVNRNFAPLTAK